MRWNSKNPKLNWTWTTSASVNLSASSRLGQVGRPSVLPGPAHTGIGDRIDDLGIDIGEEFEVEHLARVLDDVAGVLGDATPRVPGGDHGHLLDPGRVLEIGDELLPAAGGRSPGERVVISSLAASSAENSGVAGSSAIRLISTVRLSPSGSAQTESSMSRVGLGRLQRERDGDGGLIGDEVGQAGVGQADDRHAGGHGLGHRQAKALAPRRMDVAAGQAVQGLDLAIVEVTVDPTNVGWVGVAGAKPIENLPTCCGGWGMSSGSATHPPAVERGEVRLEEHVDSLAGKGRADVQERERSQVGQFRRLDVAVGSGGSTPFPTTRIGMLTPSPGARRARTWTSLPHRPDSG